jgi:hypothetical protein
MENQRDKEYASREVVLEYEAQPCGTSATEFSRHMEKDQNGYF